MGLPFPLSVLEMPFQAYDAVRGRIDRGRYRDEVRGGVSALQAEDFRNAGLDPRAIMPLTPMEREQVFAQIEQAQPPGYRGVQEQITAGRNAAPPTRERLRRRRSRSTPRPVPAGAAPGRPRGAGRRP